MACRVEARHRHRLRPLFGDAGASGKPMRDTVPRRRRLCRLCSNGSRCVLSYAYRPTCGTVHQWIVSEVPVDSPVGAIRCRHARRSSSGRSARARRCITTAPCSERSGAMHSVTRSHACLCAYLCRVARSAQLPLTAHGIYYAIYDIQHTTYNSSITRHAAVQHTACSMQHATYTQRTTCDGRHVTCDVHTCGRAPCSPHTAIFGRKRWFLLPPSAS
jgi:hypothetical protein